jgi:predicted anti-sigma-YlaC factor YlaD
MVDCERYREAISARIDGEDPVMAEVVLARHLVDCATCLAWESESLRATRVARLRPAEAVPDLTGSIMAAIAAEPRGARPVTARSEDDAPVVIRITVALVAFAQVLIAAPALVGNDLGATVHIAHEQGAWGLALAAAFGLAAWRPARASAVLPLLSVFVAAMSVLTLSDVLSGRVAPSAELPHLMAAVGLMLLWLETHPPAGLTLASRPAPAPPRQRIAA